MRSTFTVISVAGIPVKIHWNWLITALLVTWTLARGYFPQENPSWSSALYWVTAILTAALFFVSILLHEFGHAIVAKKENVRVQSITLFVFGGVAHIENEPETPGAEFRIVLAGPLTSFALALIFHVISVNTDPSGILSAGTGYLSSINLILAIFNLIPGFPLDGGRILRSLLWWVVGNFTKATRWATNIGYGIAGVFFAIGVVFIYFGNIIGGLWILFIGGYLGLVAHGARMQINAVEEEHRVIETALASARYSRPPLVWNKTAVLEPVKITTDRLFDERVVRAKPFKWGQDPGDRR